MKKILSSLIVILIICLNACQDKNDFLMSSDGLETPVELMSLEQQMNYTKTHLSEIGGQILRLSGNQEFRNLVYSEVAKQFDADYNVLLKTLIKELY